MNPWVTIWTNTTETIDKFKDSDWVNRAGFLPYFIFGINAASEAEIPRLLGYGVKSEGLVPVVSIMLIVGILAGIILKVLWVNVIFFFGKIWKGQASRRNIDTVVSLCLFPEIFKLINLILNILIQDSMEEARINNALLIICYIIGFRILIIGLARVQRFSYGIAILNIFTPQLTLGILYYSIRGF